MGKNQAYAQQIKIKLKKTNHVLKKYKKQNKRFVCVGILMCFCVKFWITI